MTALPVDVWGPPPPGDDDLPDPRPRPHEIRVTCTHRDCNSLVGWIRRADVHQDLDAVLSPWRAESPEHLPWHVEPFRRPDAAARWVLSQHDLDEHNDTRHLDAHRTRLDADVAAVERLSLGILVPLLGTGSCLNCSCQLVMRDGVWSDELGGSTCPGDHELCPNLCRPNRDTIGRATSCPFCAGRGHIIDTHHPIPDIEELVTMYTDAAEATVAVQDGAVR
ncbi:hypothetical protein [Pseudonocardia sp. T1-2H]|uniref:hypothetical protein n=1 Tax=Pseudonocardia sp. T1-2H TaxID=3128899 RepID=UPI003100F426